jgi:elongation factor Ts
MDCKKALKESDGDIEKATKLLKEKGLAEVKQRSGREAKEGAINVFYSKDRNEVIMVEVNCETDFVSRTDKYKEFVQKVSQVVFDEGTENPADLPESVQKLVKGAIASFGENILLRKIVKFNKTGENLRLFHSYIHLGGKVGVIIEFFIENENIKEDNSFKEFINNVALQIASMGPLSISREDFSEKLVEEQREIFSKQAKESGKPEKIIEKIVTGRMNKYFSEMSLLEQKYVKDSDLTIGKYLAGTEKKVNGKIEVKRFARFKLGEE